MRLTLVSPTYGHADPSAVRSRIRAAMFAARHGVEWMDDVSYDREEWSSTRNLSWLDSMRHEIDGVMWIDSDMVIEPHFIHNLVNSGHGIIGALCFDRRPPHDPVAWSGYPPRRIRQWSGEILPVDGLGFGCLYTSSSSLSAVGGFDKHEWGEDYAWMEKARKSGLQPYVDTSLRCGHLGPPTVITEMDYLMLRGEYRASPTLPPDVNPNKPGERWTN